jgi:predicted 3-demethylubiquinone-9 3-methyltransferase (glyoxalase superfamily)
MINQTISPFLWFDNQAEDAAKFYVSIFQIQRSEQLFVAPLPGPVLKAA